MTGSPRSHCPPEQQQWRKASNLYRRGLQPVQESMCLPHMPTELWMKLQLGSLRAMQHRPCLEQGTRPRCHCQPPGRHMHLCQGRPQLLPKVCRIKATPRHMTQMMMLCPMRSSRRLHFSIGLSGDRSASIPDPDPRWVVSHTLAP